MHLRRIHALLAVLPLLAHCASAPKLDGVEVSHAVPPANTTTLDQIVRSQPVTREIHIIADNLSAHKTVKVTDFLAAHPHVHMHYTPTYASWLNQVELWFAKVKRDLLARGIFTSVMDLARKLRRFITKYNERAKPVRWAYADPARRIA